MRSLGLVLLLCLAGCGLLPVAGPRPEPLPAFTAQLEMELLWRRKVGNGQPRDGRLQPVLRDDVLYVAAANGMVSALRAEDGEPLWSARPLLSISGGVGVGSGLVLVGGPRGMLAALSATDGTLRWRRRLGAALLSAPASAGGLVVASTAAGQLHALAAEDGGQRWTYRARNPLLGLRGHASPLLLDDAVVAGFAGARVVSLERSDGALRWELRIDAPSGSTPVARLRDVDGALLLDGPLLYATAYQGVLAAIDWRRGQSIWSQPLAALHGPVSALGSLFVAGADGVVSAWDRLSGVERWRVDSLRHRRLSPLAVVSRYLALCDGEGWCQVLKQRDGSYAARFRHGRGGVSAAPCAAGERLYIYGDRGVVEAWRLSERAP